jgi:hypothetical protein
MQLNMRAAHGRRDPPRSRRQTARLADVNSDAMVDLDLHAMGTARVVREVCAAE